MITTIRQVTLSALPDEALELVVYYLQHSSLASLSLVSKRFNSLARPQLWSSLDLGKRDAPELKDMHIDLFGSSKGLGNLHFKTVQVQMLEELAESNAHHDDESDDIEDMMTEDSNELHDQNNEEIGNGTYDLLQRQEWVDKSLHAIRSIGTLELELCLMESPDIEPFLQVFLPALKGTIDAFKDKVSDMQIWIDAFELCEHNQDGASRATRKLAAILLSFPAALLTSLHINGLHLDDGALLDSSSIQQTMSSSLLRSLTLKETGGNFHSWQPTNLRSLTMSWSSDNSATDLADLKVALPLMRLSAGTLESIVLQNIMAADYSGIDFGAHIKLPELLLVTIADGQLGPGSVLDTLLEWTTMPKVKMLEIETEDIVSPVLSHLPDKLLALRFLRLTEGRLRANVNEAGAKPSAYEGTVKACERAGIHLATNYNCLRCETGEDLESELGRISIISKQLTGLSMACTSAALYDLNAAEIVDLPILKKLSLGITDFAYHAEGGDLHAGTGSTSFKHFVQLLSAPSVDDLQVTLFVQGNDCTFLGELKEVLEEGQFPRLEKLGGAVLAGQTTSHVQFRQQETHVRELCVKLGVESSSLRFMSREDLIGQAEAENDDWVDEDDDEVVSGSEMGSEDEADDEAEIVEEEEAGSEDDAGEELAEMEMTVDISRALLEGGMHYAAETKKPASIVSSVGSDSSWATEEEDSGRDGADAFCCCSHHH